EYLRNLIIVKAAGASLVDSSDEVRAVLEEQAAQVSQGALLRAGGGVNASLSEIRSGWEAQPPPGLAVIGRKRPVQDDVPEKPAPPREARKAKPAAKQAAAEPEEEVSAASEPEPEGGESGSIRLSQVQEAWGTIQKVVKEKNNPLATLLGYVT